MNLKDLTELIKPYLNRPLSGIFIIDPGLKMKQSFVIKAITKLSETDYVLYTDFGVISLQNPEYESTEGFLAIRGPNWNVLIQLDNNVH